MPCDYEKLKKIGRGKYSEVYSGLDIYNQRVVMKFLKPVKKERINREVKIMATIRGCPFVNSIKDVVKDNVTNSTVIVNDFVEVSHHSLIDKYATITPYETKYYVFKILTALYHVHSKGVMHRDIKPQNVLVNSHTKDLRVIDWGLAEFYIPGK